MKRCQKMTITSDPMFGMVMGNKELGLDNQDIKQRLMKSFNLTAEQAVQAVQNK